MVGATRPEDLIGRAQPFADALVKFLLTVSPPHW